MLFFGHSHYAVQYKAAILQGCKADYLYLVGDTQAYKLTVQEMADKFLTLSTEVEPPIIFNILGIESFWCMWNNYKPLEFFLHENDSVYPGCPIVPKNLIVSFTKTINSSLHFPELLLKAKSLVKDRWGTVSMCHFAAPPPIYWENMPPQAVSLVYKAWVVANDVRREICETNGIRFIDPPEESRDQNGFLHQKFTTGRHHGNLDYGHACINKLKTLGII